ncbi:MAG: radical SAM protein [Deltaproteobacteria bacterium]|nr:radical SAM protein [Deltaproteobacteria bacterium]
MRILFLAAPHRYEIFEENLEVVTEEFGIHPPLGLAIAAAAARSDGHEVKIIDAYAERLGADQVAKRAGLFNPDLLALRIHSTYRFWQDIEFIRSIKSRLGVPVLAGGYHISRYPKESMQRPEIDFAFQGHVGPDFSELLLHLSKDPLSPPPEKIKGVVFRDKNGDIVSRPPRSGPKNLDELPFPARDLLKNEKYYQFITQRKPFTAMVTSQGCPYNCTFCVMGREQYRERSVQNVMAEIDECVQKYGIREIDFFDPTFTANKRRTRELCEALVARNYDLKWACRTRVDCVDPELLGLMNRAGCSRIYLGIENISSNVLEKINKEITSDQAAKAIEWSRDAGIQPLGFFMIGNPGDTPRTVRDMVLWAKRARLDYVQFSRTIAKPFTDLYSKLVKETGQDYWRNFVLGLEDARALPRPWCEMSDHEIERLTNWAYRSFYFRPFIVWRRLKNLKSLEELARYVRVTAEMSTRMVFRKYFDIGNHSK